MARNQVTSSKGNQLKVQQLLIPEIKKKLSDNLNSEVNFRRVENVGPKVSAELLKSGVIAISLSLTAMLFYDWEIILPIL